MSTCNTSGGLRCHKIDLVARKSWCESDDPRFGRQSRRRRGALYRATQEAIVRCVDEKPSIQALERAQGILKLPNDAP